MTVDPAENGAEKGDWTPVLGTVKDPSPYLRAVPDLSAAPPDALSQHLAKLLALHQEIASRLGAIDLARMTETAKGALLAEINRLLGIRPLRGR